MAILIPIIALVGLITLARKTIFKRDKPFRYSPGTHVVISGGSKGIGKALAIRYAQLGVHVTIIARNQKDLELAKSEVDSNRRNSNVQQIRTVSLDLTTISYPEQQGELLEKILGDHERCDILINCCGTSIPLRFEDISQKQFEQMMQVNYFSAVNLTRILLPVMKARYLTNLSADNNKNSKGARIVFVSSICGLLSFYGYSAYSGSKFALVGLAEALAMELRPFDIGVTVSFPPDTDTPGYKEENKMKPALTAKMSESGSVFSPGDVANALIDDIIAKNFYSTIGLENHAVIMATNTFMPSKTIPGLLIECITAIPLKIFAFFILNSWNKMVDAAAADEINRAKNNQIRGVKS